MGFFHKHRWRVKGCHQMALFHHLTEVRTPVTEVLMVCACGDVKTIQLEGHWTLEQMTPEDKMDKEFLRKLGVKT